MNVSKILLISILHFGSKVQSLGWPAVASNLEPFLSSSQGVYIENGGFWKEYTNSNKALYAYQDPDPISSRFYPKLFKHGNGALVYFECGGGYPKTVIEVYGKGFLYCGPLNGTPTRHQLFNIIDSENGTIAIRSIVTHGHVVMWHNYPFAGRGAGICESDDCRFNLVYPPKKQPIFELQKLTLNTKKIQIDHCDDDNVENVGDPVYYNLNYSDRKRNFTHQFVANRTRIHTTDWSFNFGLKNYQFERSLNISKIWSGLSNSIIIGFGTSSIPFCKKLGATWYFDEGTPFCKGVNVTFKKTVTMEVDPKKNFFALFRVKACKANIPFTAKIHRTEFDTLTGMPIYSNLTEHGFWRGFLLGDNPHIECWWWQDKEHTKDCRIFEEENVTVP